MSHSLFYLLGRAAAGSTQANEVVQVAAVCSLCLCLAHAVAAVVAGTGASGLLLSVLLLA